VPPNQGLSVAVVGLGNLGNAIASRLIERGWHVSVLDKDRGRVEDLISKGARATDAAGLADSAFIAFAVPDDSAIRSVLGEGLARRLTAEHTVVVASTVLPDAAREVAELVSPAGYLDVPVSGGADRARSGDLTLFVGGGQETVRRADRLLADLGNRRFLLGEVGAASATKLAHQVILFSALAGIHEGLQLTGAYKVPDELVLEAVSTGLADTWVGRNWGFFDRLTVEYEQSGVPREDRPYSKDVREAVEAAANVGVEVPLSRLLAERLPDVIEAHASAWADREGAVR
jgi:3-hydroxyisobutyrate dehydrogenase-like beta-hydroxyacid dehydrogenase